MKILLLLFLTLMITKLVASLDDVIKWLDDWTREQREKRQREKLHKRYKALCAAAKDDFTAGYWYAKYKRLERNEEQ